MTIIFTTIAFILFVTAQVVAPPYLTISALYSYPVSHRADPIEPDPCQEDSGIRPLLAHISDLHITDQERTRDNRSPGNEPLKPIIERINAYKPRYLLISGDITDEGTAAQWGLVEESLSRLDRGTAILISTGNHDLNYFFGRDPVENPWTWFGLFPVTGLEAQPRIFRAAKFQARHLPEMYTSSSGSLGDVVTNVPNESNMGEFQKEIMKCAISCVSNAGLSSEEVKAAGAYCPITCANNLESILYHYYRGIAELFPLTYIDHISGTAFIAMNTSMVDSTSPGRNAIGLSGDVQIENLRLTLSLLPRGIKQIVMIMHHPLIWDKVPPLPHFETSAFLNPFSFWETLYSSEWFVAAFLHNDIQEAEQVYTMLRDELGRRPGTFALVLYGHRHQRSLSRIGQITLQEAPNVATSDPGDYGFYLVRNEANSVRVSWCGIASNN